MKILVTGGAGFIGSHVVDEYINSGHDVIIIDDLSSGTTENINSKAKFYKISVCSDKIDDIFKNEKPDMVNHHAAQISIPCSIRNPINDAEINIIGILNILEKSVKYNVKKIIFSSSGGAVYGDTDEYPTTESCSPNPVSPYAVSKYASEKYLFYYYKQYNLNYTILRYSNVYGPRQKPEGEAGVLSIFIKLLLNNQTPIIYAYPDKPEGMIRDYVYVKDIAEANLSVLKKGNQDLINISSGLEYVTKDLYNVLIKIMNKNINPIISEPRPGDLKKSCLSNEKAKKLLEWIPKIDIQSGIEKTYKFYKEKI